MGSCAIAVYRILLLGTESMLQGLSVFMLLPVLRVPRSGRLALVSFFDAVQKQA